MWSLKSVARISCSTVLADFLERQASSSLQFSWCQGTPVDPSRACSCPRHQTKKSQGPSSPLSVCADCTHAACSVCLGVQLLSEVQFLRNLSPASCLGPARPPAPGAYRPIVTLQVLQAVHTLAAWLPSYAERRWALWAGPARYPPEQNRQTIMCKVCSASLGLRKGTGNQAPAILRIRPPLHGGQGGVKKKNHKFSYRFEDSFSSLGTALVAVNLQLLSRTPTKSVHILAAFFPLPSVSVGEQKLRVHHFAGVTQVNYVYFCL